MHFRIYYLKQLDPTPSMTLTTVDQALLFRPFVGNSNLLHFGTTSSEIHNSAYLLQNK
ncbi:hypothetical protein RchiOBHm_Chr2g0159621 [Rosa chinensis]|uniref:Uncharacterized protein n=1 Tax=Rosa chinensis TaxID=74649 RepID=A0A2P6S2B8_ROSCH|nr:hypothetical protein RchiOBHm_Chr2g0159621 [Rosa chinensis]